MRKAMIAVSLLLQAAGLVCLLAAGGCATSRGRVVANQTFLPFTEDQRLAITRVQAAPYRLQRGDVFDVSSLYDEELRQSNILVLPDGTATFVGIGKIPVAGMTLQELDEKLTAAYARIFRDVDIDIVLRQVSGQQVYVLGEVKNPGLYKLSNMGIGIMGAIAEAGGFADWASQGSVILMRLQPDGYLCRKLDLKSLRDGAFDPAAIDLQPYDIIYVSRSKIGNLAAFTKDLAGSLVQYTRLILDIKQIQNPSQFYRR